MIIAVYIEREKELDVLFGNEKPHVAPGADPGFSKRGGAFVGKCPPPRVAAGIGIRACHRHAKLGGGVRAIQKNVTRTVCQQYVCLINIEILEFDSHLDLPSLKPVIF